MTGLPGGAFFVGVRGLAGAWRVLDGFLTGSWRVLGGFLAGANMRPKMAFAGWEGLAFERGGRVWLSKGVGGFWLSRGGRVWLSKGVGEAGCLGMLGARALGVGEAGAGHAWGWMLGRLGLGVACYLSFCRLVLFAKPTTFAIVKTKATPPRGACYGINTNTHNHY